QQNVLTNFGLVRNQYTKVRFDLLQAQGKLAAHKLKEKLATELNIPEATINEAVEADPDVKALAARAAGIAETLDRAELKGEGSYRRGPMLVQAQLRALKEKTDEVRAQKRVKLVEDAKRHARAEYQVALAQLQDEVSYLDGQLKTLDTELAALNKEADKIGTSSTELEMLRADIEQGRKAFDVIGGTLQAATV